MAKQSGLGDNLYIGGYDVSGDTNSLRRIGGGPNPGLFTGIDKSGVERIGLTRDGGIEWVSFFNDATDQQHAALKSLPTADVMASYERGTLLGSPAACQISKQANYDPTRGDDGMLTFAVQALANGFGLEWGRQLTAGKRTDTGATNGASIDTTAALSFGAQAYLQVFSVAGTSVTVAIEDSADNAAFAPVAGLGFTAVLAGNRATQRLATSNTATIRRYLRAITTGTFSSAVFAVTIVKNEIANVQF